jgi:hypothetical protein
MKKCNCEYCECKKQNSPEEIFNTEEFKNLPWKKRAWIRIQIAFMQTISMI